MARLGTTHCQTGQRDSARRHGSGAAAASGPRLRASTPQGHSPSASRATAAPAPTAPASAPTPRATATATATATAPATAAPTEGAAWRAHVARQHEPHRVLPGRHGRGREQARRRENRRRDEGARRQADPQTGTRSRRPSECTAAAPLHPSETRPRCGFALHVEGAAPASDSALRLTSRTAAACSGSSSGRVSERAFGAMRQRAVVAGRLLRQQFRLREREFYGDGGCELLRRLRLRSGKWSGAGARSGSPSGREGTPAAAKSTLGERADELRQQRRFRQQGSGHGLQRLEVYPHSAGYRLRQQGSVCLTGGRLSSGWASGRVRREAGRTALWLLPRIGDRSQLTEPWTRRPSTVATCRSR